MGYKSKEISSKNFTHLLVWVLLGTVALSACSESKNQSTTAPSPTEAPPQVETPEYIKAESKSQFGGVESYVLNQKTLTEKATQLSQAELNQIDLGEDFNAVAYRVSGEDSRSIILRPKLFLKNSALGEGVQIRQAEDGKVSLFLSIAVTNGLDSQIEAKKLPEDYLIRGREKFLTALESKLLKKPVFIGETQCPSRMTLKVNGLGDVPIEFHTPLKSCPINRLFPVTLKIKATDWKNVMDALLQDGNIQVNFDLDMRIPLLRAFAKFSLQKRYVKDWMKDALLKRSEGLFFPVSATDLEDLETSLVGEIQKSFGTTLEIGLFSEVKARLNQELFFERMGADCLSGDAKCFVWKSDNSMEGIYSFNLFSYEYFGKPLKVQSTSGIPNIMNEPTPFLLKSAQGSQFSPPTIGELNNLFQTVFEGEILDFNFQHFRVNQITWEHPDLKFVDNQTCVDRGPAPTHEEDDLGNCAEYNVDCNQWNSCNAWADQCTEWSAFCCRAASRGFEHCAEIRTNDPNNWHGYRDCSNNKCVNSRHYCSQPVHECVPGHWYNTSCRRWAKKLVPSGEGPCNKWESQWQRITTYSIPSVSSSWKEQDIQTDQISTLIDGLSIRFDLPSPEGMKELDCKLSDMDYRVLSGNRLLVVFQNTEKCQPFGAYTRLPGHGPSISMINQFALPFQYQCGQMTENWKGMRSWSCRLPDGSEKALESTVTADTAASTRGEKLGIYETYYPRTEIYGLSRVVGSYLKD